MERVDKRYTVLVDDEAHFALAAHAVFLAKVNISAAERITNKVYDDIGDLDHDPARFPRHISHLYPDGDYRSMITCKRYKVIYEIMEDVDTVHVINVIDCRMDEFSPNE